MSEKYTLDELVAAANEDPSWESDEELRKMLTEYLVMSVSQ